MQATEALSFASPSACLDLDRMTDAELDELSFGVIGFDRATVVTVYNALEARAAGLDGSRVLGRPLFEVVAPCMNNFMVAHRFEEAALSFTELDATIPYVLTLRMKPVKVQLRLLSRPSGSRRYVLVKRNA